MRVKFCSEFFPVFYVGSSYFICNLFRICGIESDATPCDENPPFRLFQNECFFVYEESYTKEKCPILTRLEIRKEQLEIELDLKIRIQVIEAERSRSF